MSIRSLLAFLVFFSACLYIALLNRESISFTYYPGSTIVIQPVLLVFGFFALGVVSVFLASFFGAYRNQMSSWRVSRTERTERKLKEIHREGKEAEATGNVSSAESSYRKILKRNPEHLDALIALGNLYRKSGKIREAIELHARAHLLHGNDVELLIALAKDYVAANSYADALEVMGSLIKANPTSHVALSEANKILIRLKEWRLVTENQKRLIALTYESDEKKKESRELARYIYELILDLWGKNEMKGMERLIKEGISYDETFMPLHLILGEYYERDGNVRKALKVWWRAYTESVQVIFLKKIEEVHRRTNNTEKVFALYYDALGFADQNPVIYLLAGKIFMELGRPDLAIRTIEQAKTHFKDTIAYNLALFETYRNNGRIAEAEEISLNAAKEAWSSISKYRCAVCSTTYDEWQVRCDSCNSLDTLRFSSSLLPASQTGMPTLPTLKGEVH